MSDINVQFSTGNDCLVLTEGAAAQVKKLAEQENNPQLMLRVFITGGGCSGFQYGFEFDDKVNDDDICIEKDGATMVIDAMSMQYMNGAEVGFQQDLTGSQFVVHNPTATTTCGCGASFSV
ncbi:MAG: iron-sulfur cluster insertion protein ErpA [Gammaproteobacteria bacterium]|nr:iron-sulfur cluster insertion protein ErpA [Gammaproteobacteria bacterium]